MEQQPAPVIDRRFPMNPFAAFSCPFARRLRQLGRTGARAAAAACLWLGSPAPANDFVARVVATLSPAASATAALPAPLQVALALPPVVEVDSTGIHLDQLVRVPTNVPLPHVKVAPAPSLSQPVTLGRAQVIDWLRAHGPDLSTNHWTGPERMTVRRKTRALDESEVRRLLEEALQRDFVKDRGDLELRLLRPWSSVVIPDEPLLLRIVDLPSSGPNPNFITRFELLTGEERIGGWQLSASAKIWREVPVASIPLPRGQRLSQSMVSMERRDMLALRDPPWLLPIDDASLETLEVIQAGQPILARSLRQRPVVQRGQLIDGVVRDGTFAIALKVEALADGVPGQLLRVRNPRTKRELTGKVLNDETVLISY